MKKINYKGLSDVLSEEELKNVVGGGSGISGCWNGSTCLSNNYCSSAVGITGTCYFDSMIYHNTNGTSGCFCI